MANETKIFPAIPLTHWINLRNQFKKSIPGTVTTNYISSVLGMSESSAKTNILPSLRMIYLIDKNGIINQELAKKFRDDSLYKEFCQEILSDNYPQEVRDAFPDTSSDKEKVKSWFMNHSGVGSNAGQKITAFYFILLEANTKIEVTSTTLKSTDKIKSKKIIKKPTKKDAQPIQSVTASTQVPHTNDKIISTKKSMPDLNINIQIHISSDATPDQIEEIFKAMSKHIYLNK